MSENPTPEPGTCESCGDAPATVLVRKVTAGEESEFRLCANCAQEKGLEGDLGGVPVDPVTLLFRGLEEAQGSGTCPDCGLGYSQFRETGRLGCAVCYQTFAEELEPLLRRVHGSVGHAGKVPMAAGGGQDPSARLRRLNEDLERAVNAEDYERAAGIRDLIRELETTGARKDKP